MPKTQPLCHPHFQKIRFKVSFFLTVLASLIYQNTWSQNSSEVGLPIIVNYSPIEYGAFDQNWNVVQDSLGILYFANGYGILTYNGASWNLIKLPNKATVFALSIADNGQIYVGGTNEIGYLEQNNIGQLNYVSLLSKLPKKYHDFNQIRFLCKTEEGLFFASEKYIFKWDGKTFETWKNFGDYRLYNVNNRLFLRSPNKGLTEFIDGRFKLMQNGELFADKVVRAILPFKEKELLIATEEKLYIHNESTIREFKTDAPEFFKEKNVYTGISLDNGTYAFGSKKNGVLIINSEGNKEVLLSKEENLRSHSVLSLFQDKSGLIWATLQSGISKIEYPSPFSFYNNQNNTPDMVYDFQRFQEKFFVGASDGLHILNSAKKSRNNYFEAVTGDFSVVFELTNFQDRMLVASKWVYEIDEKERPNKLFNLNATSLYSSKIDSNRVFIGSSPGLQSMYFKNREWKLEHKFEGIDTKVAKITEMNDGTLWLDLGKTEVIRVSFDNLNDAEELKNPKIDTFTNHDGLSENHEQLFVIDNQIYSNADTKIYQFNHETENFFEDEILLKRLGLENRKVNINTVDDQGNIWLIEYNGNHRLEQLVALLRDNGTYELNKLNEKRIIDKRKFGTLPELKDGIVWYKGRPGIVRHDLKQKLDKSALNSKAIITDIFYKNDSLLFGGYSSTLTQQIPFKNNQLRFQYANPSFYDESKNQFQYILEGFDKDWSTWTFETKKDYTNIPGGDYTFKVRSKNIFNAISGEDSYSFTILPPWYRAWWTYLLYGLGAIGILILYSKWRSQELQKKNLVLENTIDNRTLEIRQKNELLNHQTEQLIQLNNSKTRMYSNITHEFRTPLTVILGMADTLKKNVKDKTFDGAEKSLEMIRRNGKNLLLLVNEMLDLVKVESGSMELNLVQTDAIPFVKYLSESFNSFAATKNINLTVYSEIDALQMDVDVNKMASIISNLLSNAIKFTGLHGKIIVHLNKTADGKSFIIKVQDNGVGLAKENLGNLFDRFYQVENIALKNQKGTGIGLSLTKEFVELMNGTIEVESTLGKGSTFTVQLPVTNKAAKNLDVQMNPEPPIKVVPQPVQEESLLKEGLPDLPLVLLIEDNLDVAHYLQTCLKDSYKTIHAIDGIKGLEMAYEHIPDIIISDVMMPGKDGFEVCGILKSDERTDHIPIILLTAKVTTEDRLAGLTHGADAYLAKPFNQEELFTRLDQLILVRKKLIGKLEKNGLTFLLKEKVENPQTKFLKQVIECIHTHLDDADFGPTQLAKKIYLSESQVYRKLKAITDKSTAIFIRSVRLQKAKELIETTDKTISEIAYQVGFKDPSWFSRAFKKEFDIAPSDIHK